MRELSGKRFFFLIIAMMIIGLSAGCTTFGRKTDIEVLKITTNSVSTAGCALEHAYTPYKEGILYCEKCCIKFLDFETGLSRFICSQPNCRHSDTDCSAFIGPNPENGGFVAYSNGLVYFVSADYDTGYYVLKAMNTNGTDQRTILRLNLSNYSAGERIYKINTISYLETGIAVIECGFGIVPDLIDEQHHVSIDFKSLILLVDLQSGKIVDEIGEGAGYTVDASYPEYIVLIRFVLNHEMLQNIADIEEQYPEQFPTIDDYRAWYFENYCPSEEIAVYSINEKTLKTVVSEDCLVYRLKYDNSLNYCGTVYSLGILDNVLYYGRMSEHDIDCEDRDIAQIDLFSMEGKDLFSIKNGGPIVCGAHFLDSIIDGSKILFVTYDNEMPDQRKYGDIWTLDLITGKVNKHFTDLWNIKYRVVGETDDSYIITIDNTGCYKVLKQNYYMGDFSDIKKYSIAIGN